MYNFVVKILHFKSHKNILEINWNTGLKCWKGLNFNIIYAWQAYLD